ncbi:MAG: hypothetical protein ACOZNI_27690 [Myxococcota bacterium]
MPPIELIEQLRSPHDFKAVVDAILRLKYGDGLTTFAAGGTDGGVDALFEGRLDRRLPAGTWVFQYKYASPLASGAAGRASVMKPFLKADRLKSEFAKARALDPVGYVLVTSAAFNPQGVRKLEMRCADVLPGARFLAWDRSALNADLRGREYLARSRDGILEDAACEHVVVPLHNLVTSMLDRVCGEYWYWPLEFGYQPPGFREAGVIGHLEELGRHPLFARARHVAFPRAFAGFEGVRIRLHRLRDLARKEMERVRRAYEGAPVLGIERASREHVLLDLTVSTLEGAWSKRDFGEPTQEGSTFRVGPRVWTFDGAGAELLPFIQRVYGSERAHGMPEKLKTARQRLATEVDRLATQLWYPAVLGIDCPDDPLRP